MNNTSDFKKGMCVSYKDYHKYQYGVVSSINDKYVFVKYDNAVCRMITGDESYTAAATLPGDLKIIKESIKQEIYELDKYFNSRGFNKRQWLNNTFLYMDNQLSEDFMREFREEIDWCDISEYQTLSENFIREFKDYIEWLLICKYQKLSEDFIREFKDNVDWVYIICYQKISNDFIEEFKDYINLKYMLEKDKISKNFYNRLIKISRSDLLDI